MANELYSTYEVLVEESVHRRSPQEGKGQDNKPSLFNAEIDGALRDTHMIFQDAGCYNTLCFAGWPEWSGTRAANVKTNCSIRCGTIRHADGEGGIKPETRG